jgi:hypothetical protein
VVVLLIAAYIAYCAVAYYFWRRWSWESYQHQSYRGRSDAVFIGLVQAVVWPAVFAWKTVAHSDTFMLAPPAVRAQEREAMLQARIDELERDLRIRDSGELRP